MSIELKVSKFGGSSMRDLSAMRQSAAIALSKNSNLIVVSATYGTTNQIIALSKQALIGSEVSWNACQEIIDEINMKHRSLASDACLNEQEFTQLEAILKEVQTLSRGIFLLKECSNKAMDSLLSVGERLSSLIFTRVLNEMIKEKKYNRPAVLLDARKILRTDNNFSKAKPLTNMMEKIAEQSLNDCIKGNVTFVTQGFIGATADGETTTLGRGGSDYSASLFAEAIKASVLEIWTDVAGIATTDPRICPEAKPISEISYREAAQMATFGAKVLHPTTLSPAIRKGIPVFVGSSYAPNEEGTWIKDKIDFKPLVRALAKREAQGLITVRNPKMLDTHGFLFAIFEIFEKFKISADALTTSEITVSISVDEEVLSHQAFMQDLKKMGEVIVEKDFALISIIGNKINHTHGLAKRIFQALENINVRLICLGASEHNFCVLVNQERADEALQKLHKEFIEDKDSTNGTLKNVNFSNPAG